MILAQEFSRSATGRRSDFSTSTSERGVFTLLDRSSSSQSPRERRVRGSLIAQFAANDAKTFADACELIYPHVDGVDLNCGTYPGPKHQCFLFSILILILQCRNMSFRLSAEMGLSGENWLIPSKTTRHGVPSFCNTSNCPKILRWIVVQVRDLVRAARDRTGWNFPVSIKIRLDPDPKFASKFFLILLYE